MFSMTDRPLTEEEFKVEYRVYMLTNQITFEDWELRTEWKRYNRGRSWFLYTFHGEHALAVGNILSKGG